MPDTIPIVPIDPRYRSWKDDEKCLELGGVTYGNEEELLYEGSGGPSNDAFSPSGGPGGGLIQINVEDTLNLDGNVISQGQNGVANKTGGGGSGGSIQVVTVALRGTGTLDAIGGKGSDFNSGGGSGGRVSVRFWKSTDIDQYPDMTGDWMGFVRKDGGSGAGTGGFGSEGTLFTTRCQAGYSGAF